MHMTSRTAPVALAAIVGVALMATTAVMADDDKSFDERKAEKALKEAAKARDLAKIDAVTSEMHSLEGDDAEAAIMLLLKFATKMPYGEDALYWRLVRGAALFHDEAALSALGDFIIKQKKSAFARDIVFSLQDNVNTTTIPLLARLLEKAPGDLQLLAVDRLGAIRSVESVDALIAAYKEEKGPNELTRRIVRALKGLTGADMGEAENWDKWWQIERANGLTRAKERSGGSTVTADLDPTRHSEYEELKKLTDKILVLKAGDCRAGGFSACNFDHIESMLDRMEVKHKVATKEDFNKGIVSLDGIVAVVINCTQTKDHCLCPTCTPGGGKNMRLLQCTGCDKHDLYNHRLSDKSIEALANFVRAGGFLFSEDWVLEEMHAKAFPKQLAIGKYLKEMHVDTFPARGATSHPYMRGVFRQPAPPAPKKGEDGGGTTVVDPPDPFVGSENAPKEYEWKVDDESPSIRVVDPKSVTTLLVSKKLRDASKTSKNSTGDEAVAITWVPHGARRGGGRATTGGKRGGEGGGTGRILHVMSHFGKQNSNDAEFVLQNLLLNFLLEASKRVQ